MRKTLLIWLALTLWVVLTGCSFFKILDWNGMEREIRYPVAEQECIDNDGQISTNHEWTQICVFSDDEFCYLEDMEDWWCDLLYPGWWEWITVVTDMCEEEWWNVQQWNEWWDIQDLCYYPDETFCYLDDLADGSCHKWDMKYDDWLGDELAACDVEWENIVCWEDWNTYYNRCYLDFAWVEEETELAEVVDGQCVFG